MAGQHHVLRADDGEFVVPRLFADRSSGFRRRTGVDATTGSVHMGFGIVELDAGGSVDWHVHSFEESIFVLEGEVVCETDDGPFRLGAGDYGVIAVGAPHAWRNAGQGRARWADMLAPQPRADAAEDTFFVPDRSSGREPVAVDPRDPRTRSFGHIEPGNMDPGRQRQDLLAQSASMRTALLVYSGISVKMMVDSDLGADLMTMFMVQ